MLNIFSELVLQINFTAEILGKVISRYIISMKEGEIGANIEKVVDMDI